jgi:hypothetical protein
VGWIKRHQYSRGTRAKLIAELRKGSRKATAKQIERALVEIRSGIETACALSNDEDTADSSDRSALGSISKHAAKAEHCLSMLIRAIETTVPSAAVVARIADSHFDLEGERRLLLPAPGGNGGTPRSRPPTLRELIAALTAGHEAAEKLRGVGYQRGRPPEAALVALVDRLCGVWLWITRKAPGRSTVLREAREGFGDYDQGGPFVRLCKLAIGEAFPGSSSGHGGGVIRKRIEFFRKYARSRDQF